MNREFTLAILRELLLDLQSTGELSPQIDISSLTRETTLGGAGFDSVTLVTLSAMIEDRFGVVIDQAALEEGEDTSLGRLIDLVRTS